MGLAKRILSDFRKAPAWVWISVALAAGTLILAYLAYRSNHAGSSSAAAAPVDPTTGIGSGGGSLTGIGPTAPITVPASSPTDGGGTSGGIDWGSLVNNPVGIVTQAVSATGQRTATDIRSNHGDLTSTANTTPQRSDAQVNATLKRGNSDLAANATPAAAHPTTRNTTPQRTASQASRTRARGNSDVQSVQVYQPGAVPPVHHVADTHRALHTLA